MDIIFGFQSSEDGVDFRLYLKDRVFAEGSLFRLDNAKDAAQGTNQIGCFGDFLEDGSETVAALRVLE